MSIRLCVFAVICASGFTANSACAADLAGDWILNVPRDPSTWTFTQATPSSTQFTATTSYNQGPVNFRYDLNPGFTFGAFALGVETLSINGSVPTPIGVMLVREDAGTLTGKLIYLDMSSVDVIGEKVVVDPPARKPNSRGR